MKFGYVSLLPETTIVAKFMEELKNNRLMGTQCKKCGKKHLPPRAHCTCGSSEVEWFEAPRQGNLLAYTIVAFPPESMTKYAPYIIAIAELDDGCRLLTHISDVTPKNLKVGMRVQVVPHQIAADRMTCKFKPL
ncbi:MAG: Zn-ribbon domain-containing OB-fold protein [Candidatus Bathyarchaeia archaeon]